LVAGAFTNTLNFRLRAWSIFTGKMMGPPQTANSSLPGIHTGPKIYFWFRNSPSGWP